MKLNIPMLLNVDSYKASMPVQYPNGTEKVVSYIESRGGKYNDIVFFGMQAFVKEYLSEPFTQKDLDLAKEIWEAHGEPANYDLWKYILDEHGGYLPVEIKWVPEGTVVPNKNVLVTIENTDPECYWLTTYLETAMLRAIWYPSTVATNSREIKKVIAQYLNETGDITGLPFKLHDFGARGSHSLEASMLGGMGHLVNFMGTDTIAAVVGARLLYNEPMAAFSVPASEHSTITSWGRENEADAYRNMLKQFGKEGAIVSVVSDSYDIFNATENIWGKELRQEVIDSGAMLVIRPDSGDPVDVVCKVAQLIEKTFGCETNTKGYKVLNNVRILQGDGINADSIKAILAALKKLRYSADNIVFGMGGQLLGAPQRDDQKWAMKCSAVRVNGEWRDVFKDPITDAGKLSKKGRLVLVKECGLGSCSFRTITEDEANERGLENLLKTGFINGKLTFEENFANIRARAEI